MATFEFIIVGGGPAGCALAWKLASSRKRPSILLLEAGGDNGNRNVRSFGDRYLTRFNPEMRWGYRSTPQEQLGGRQIDLDRGKGLGGSSSINYSIHQLPPKGDFAEIARQVGDDAWLWENAIERYKPLEDYDVPTQEYYRGYVNLTPGVHGIGGPLKVGLPNVLEKQGSYMLNVLDRTSLATKNLDPNDGNSIGFGFVPNAERAGERSTSRDLLLDAPVNLTVLTDTLVERVLLEGKKAIGVRAAGLDYFASKEVILSAGTIDTPKILMLSGVGPASHLQKIGIPVVLDSPRVGKGMKDHLYSVLMYERAPHTTDRPAFWRDPERLLQSRQEFKMGFQGELSLIASASIMALVKLDKLYDSKEFKDLPEDVRLHLQDETVPLTEFLLNGPNIRDLINPSGSIPMIAIVMFLYNGQSEGEILLASTKPEVPQLIDTKMFSHPFDRRAAIEVVKKALSFTEEPAFARDTVRSIQVPKSKSDEDIWDFWKTYGTSVWHMSGSVKMGKPDDPTAVVGSDFRVYGMQNLRVADMSVIPFVVNAHPAALAYITGLTAADKIIEEYEL